MLWVQSFTIGGIKKCICKNVHGVYQSIVPKAWRWWVTMFYIKQFKKKSRRQTGALPCWNDVQRSGRQTLLNYYESSHPQNNFIHTNIIFIWQNVIFIIIGTHQRKGWRSHHLSKSLLKRGGEIIDGTSDRRRLHRLSSHVKTWREKEISRQREHPCWRGSRVRPEIVYSAFIVHTLNQWAPFTHTTVQSQLFFALPAKMCSRKQSPLPPPDNHQINDSLIGLANVKEAVKHHRSVRPSMTPRPPWLMVCLSDGGRRSGVWQEDKRRRV